MHTAATIRSALDLASGGSSAAQISERLDLPRSTVRTWLKDGPPRARGDLDAPSCPACGSSGHDLATLPASYLYLLGLYLGDGCLAVNSRGVFKLRIFLDTRYPGIMAECERAIGEVMPANKIGRIVRSAGGFANSRNGGSIEMYSYSRSWRCLLPQHGPGRKHERALELTDWQRDLLRLHPGLFLRGLVHSDGCRFINTGTNWSHPRYSFSNRSADIRRFFVEACDLLGLRFTLAPNTVYVSRKADVAVLDEHIGAKR